LIESIKKLILKFFYMLDKKIPLFQNTHASTNKVIANAAPRKVQIISVDLRLLSGTGNWLEFNTFY